jgi:hypothetical protein
MGQNAGMRDCLTHDYFGVDLALVWRVVERDLSVDPEAYRRALESPDELSTWQGGVWPLYFLVGGLIATNSV